jgi:hypothetical protein
MMKFHQSVVFRIIGRLLHKPLRSQPVLFEQIGIIDIEYFGNLETLICGIRIDFASKTHIYGVLFD